MTELQINDAQLKPIADKVFAGERLTAEDGIAMYRSPDLLAIGWLAVQAQKRLDDPPGARPDFHREKPGHAAADPAGGVLHRRYRRGS